MSQIGEKRLTQQIQEIFETQGDPDGFYFMHARTRVLYLWSMLRVDLVSWWWGVSDVNHNTIFSAD